MTEVLQKCSEFDLQAGTSRAPGCCHLLEAKLEGENILMKGFSSRFEVEYMGVCLRGQKTGN